MKTGHPKLQKLLKFITRNDGIVSVRAVAKGVAHCRAAGAAQKSPQALVEMNVGKWVNKPVAAKGGRPSRVFVLTDGQKLERQFQHADAIATAAMPAEMQRLVKGVMCLSNQHQHVSCQTFAQVFEKAAKLMGTIRSEEPYPEYRREIRFQKGGRFTVSWVCE